MNHWSPLQFIASLVVLSLVVSYAVALEASAGVRRQSWLVVGIPLQAVLMLLGLASVLGVRVGVLLAGMAGIMVCLWSQRAGDVAFGLRARGLYYLNIRRGHRAGHVRGLAA
jgi:FtsH-binding integral membrane protein